MDLTEPSEVGKWKKVSNLGEGSFGIVSLWKRSDCDEFIAVKKCKKVLPSNVTAKQRERWNNEVEVMKLLQHPNIVSYKPLPEVLDTFLNQHNPTKLPILSMEYCAKGNLRHLLRQEKNIHGLSETEVRNIVEDVSNAVIYLHNMKITHRDIKPENIVLQNIHFRKGNIVYKLIDLGYAKEIDDSTISFVGTFHYLAPEIFKNEMYNSEVDYWSLGVLIYEIISGSLPFSNFTQFEWYQLLSKKGPKDIAIIKQPDGNVAYSSQIKEYKITKCLKENFEIWLQHALQFNPTLRRVNFPNNLPVLDYLQHILHRSIVNVFSLYTYEFLSYEVDSTTLITTLKSWIERDTRISIQDQILLSNERIYESDDEKCVYEVINRDNKDLFVLKKKELKSNEQYVLPELIKILLTKCVEPLKWKTQLKGLFIYAKEFIMQEERSLHAFSQGFKLYMDYKNVIVKKVERQRDLISTLFNSLLIKIQCYSNFAKLVCDDSNICDNENLRDCLHTFQRLLASIERNKERLEILNTNVAKLLKKNDILTANNQEIDNVLNCDFHELLQEANTVFQKYEAEDLEEQIAAPIAKIIGKLLKKKEKLFTHPILTQYTKASSIALKISNNLMEWMGTFEQNIVEISEALDKNECKRYKVMVELAAQESSVKVLNGKYSVQNLHAEDLIKENQNVRYEFVDFITNSLLMNKEFCEEACNFLNEEF